ncbi:MAG: hypothetical protein QOG87_3833 [Actinomycetota bacterium]
MEPSHAHVPRRGPQPHRSLRLAATAASLALILSSSGDVVLAAVLLGVAALDVAVAGVGVGVALAVLGRWGTTSLAALAGLQAVVGPAGLRGSTIAAASSWVAAGALLVVAATVSRRLPAAALGLTAALVVAGPAVATVSDGAIRLGAGAGGALLGALVAGRSTGRIATPVALVLAAVAPVLSVLA